MQLNNYFRGGLFPIAASLVFFLSGELLKWQFPFTAAAEKVTRLAAVLRTQFSAVPAEHLLHR